ncbi:ArsR/SmtB family transcription factor [Testudinibacter sp. TR-2022]|uniref:ArsR/SmtB family transcription factor n=1 Tax=Testudinibacter sp. TR-2022 TaxID=2585029 RepID=UPI00111B199E|nr:metalloregulator ArsR/SmtB family transcription factor [Testudinibacter sp. TR-2022]TNH06994.1 winged helix-turn-helix transcriptional regulator [Pasteurellaceae bacterium Phil11]TNH22867.1 winged helix-turn-helix transcriptional regulator [Testudinibacter sp. TR-2022]TNH25283.1 winged helix-turn-helix transcriptional regulator [Testudinibacter sp. TR-2022]
MNAIQAHLAACLPLFTALGDPHRQTILLLLAEHGSLNVNRLTELMPLSRPAVSHHLKLMRQADLVRVAQAGNERFYAINQDYNELHPCPIQRLRSLVEALEAELPPHLLPDNPSNPKENTR